MMAKTPMTSKNNMQPSKNGQCLSCESDKERGRDGRQYGHERALPVIMLDCECIDIGPRVDGLPCCGNIRRVHGLCQNQDEIPRRVRGRGDERVPTQPS